MHLYREPSAADIVGAAIFWIIFLFNLISLQRCFNQSLLQNYEGVLDSLMLYYEDILIHSLIL